MNLAQKIIDHGAMRLDGLLPGSDDLKWRTIYNMVHARLTGGPVPQGGPQALAERYVFAEDAPAVMDEFIKAGSLTAETIYECARDPAGVYWIEWPNREAGRVGALVDTTLFQGSEMSTGFIFFGWMKNFNPHPIPLCGVRMPPFPWPSAGRGMRVFFGKPEWIKPCVDGILDALFLLNTPRTCSVETITAPPALQKARARRRMGPLVEFKRVKLLIAEGSRRYTRASDAARRTGETAEQHRKRLHEVIGHWRTYRKDRDVPHSVFVAPYWRGDARLGIIVHDRDVRRNPGAIPRAPENPKDEPTR